MTKDVTAAAPMTAKPTRHLRIFAISMALIAVCLVVFLFAVHLEATVPATGLVLARDQQEVRASVFGLIEPGWHEGTIAPTQGPAVKVRVDGQGNGLTDPSSGNSQPVHQYRLSIGLEILPGELKFHALQAGDEVWPGQVLARIRADDLHLQMHKLKARLEDLESRGESGREVMAEYHLLKDRLEQSVVRAPLTAEPWLVLKVFASPLQAVKPGDPIALLAPLDPQSRQPRELVALLEIEEKYAGELQPGQALRIYSTMHNHRLHGHAEGKIERLEPLAEQGPGRERLFRALAVVSHSPYPLRPGSSFKAEVVLGRKPVYRIILEQ